MVVLSLSCQRAFHRLSVLRFVEELPSMFDLLEFDALAILYLEASKLLDQCAREYLPLE